MTDLVTGEAVVLDLQPARLPSRALALLVDLTVEAVLLLTVFIAGLAAPVEADSAALAALGLISVVGVLVGYPVLSETVSRGRSLGKMAMGLRVVRDDGGPIRFRHALVRGLAGFIVDFWGTLGSGAVISSLASSNGKRIGDTLAGTMVIRERLPKRPDFVAPMPPYLAAWATSLDLSTLPDDLALAARQYLSRLRELSPAVATAVAGRLASDVMSYVSPPAPPGTPPWDLLAAVVAERRNRAMLQVTAQPHDRSRVYRPGMPPASKASTPSGFPTPPPSTPAPAPAPPLLPTPAPQPAADATGPFAPPG